MKQSNQKKPKRNSPRSKTSGHSDAAKPLKVLVIHGPNLNLLGERETAIYGSVTLAGINQCLGKEARASGVLLKIIQSNHEGEIVDLIGKARQFICQLNGWQIRHP